MLDTRSGPEVRAGEVTPVRVGDAVAAWLNVTVVDPTADGYLTAFPCDGAVPPASTLNYTANRSALANAALIPIGPSSTLCLVSSAAAHVIVDVSGRFIADGGVAYQPAVPSRVPDTRHGTGGWLGRVADGQTIGVSAVPSDSGAQAIVGTLTAIDATTAGHLTAWDGEQQPPTSNLNFEGGETIPNVEASRLLDRGFQVVARGRPGSLAFDVVGWFGD